MKTTFTRAFFATLLSLAILLLPAQAQISSPSTVLPFLKLTGTGSATTGLLSFPASATTKEQGINFGTNVFLHRSADGTLLLNRASGATALQLAYDGTAVGGLAKSSTALDVWSSNTVTFGTNGGTLALTIGSDQSSTFAGNVVKNQPVTGAGTVTTNGTTALVGSGANFTTLFNVGDTITVQGETVRTIATITDANNLTVTLAFSTSASGLTYTSAGVARVTMGATGNIALTGPGSATTGLLSFPASATTKEQGISFDTGLFAYRYGTGHIAIRGPNGDNAGVKFINDASLAGSIQGYASSIYIDSANLMKFRTNGSTDALTIGSDQSSTFAGVAKFASGTAAAPGIAFSANAGHGFWYRDGSTIGLSIGGGQIMLFGVGGSIYGPGSNSTVELPATGDIAINASGSGRCLTVKSGAALAAASGDGVVLTTATAALVGAKVQMSPRLRLAGSAWDDDGAVDDTHSFFIETLPASGNTTSATLKFGHQMNAVAATYPMTLTNAGNVVFAGSITGPTATNIYAGDQWILAGKSTAYGVQALEVLATGGLRVNRYNLPLGITSADGLTLDTSPTATAAAEVQMSPRIRLTGAAWNKPLAHATPAQHTSDFTAKLITLTTQAAHGIVSGDTVTLAGWTWEGTGGGVVNGSWPAQTGTTGSTIILLLGATCPSTGSNPTVVGVIGTSETDSWIVENLPATVAGTTTSTLKFGSSIDGGAYTYPMTLSSAGALTTTGAVSAKALSITGPAGYFQIAADAGGIKWSIYGNANVFDIGSTSNFAWKDNADATAGARDVGIERASTGVLKVTNGSTGTGAITAGAGTFSGTVTTQASRIVAIATDADARTLSATADHYVIYTGTGGHQWDLPAVATSTGVSYKLKHRGSGVLTIADSDSGNYIFTSSVVGSFTMNAGDAYEVVSDGTYWLVY